MHNCSRGVVSNLRFIDLCDRGTLRPVKLCLTTPIVSLAQLLFGGSRRARTHISSKTEALFSVVTMTQRLKCRYLTAEK